MTIAEPVLKIEDVSKLYAVSQGLFKQKSVFAAVDNVSLALNQGECLGLVGESGCGKSTLGRLACGLLAPDSGRIGFLNKDLPQAGHGSWAAGQIQMIFQDPASSLDPRMRILSSLAEPLIARGINRRVAYAKSEDILTALGLGGYGNRYPHEFSGGQKQRIAIGRALITQPKVIICDEPVSALDASVQAQILNLLKDVQAQYQLSYLFISHNLAVVGFMCPRILVMYLGQIVEKGSRNQIFTSPAHPYTKALFDAMPGGEKLWRRGEDIKRLPKALPDAQDKAFSSIGGCKFYPRCIKAEPVCMSNPPPWKNIGPDWLARCHFPAYPK